MVNEHRIDCDVKVERVFTCPECHKEMPIDKRVCECGYKDQEEDYLMREKKIRCNKQHNNLDVRCSEIKNHAGGHCGQYEIGTLIEW